MAKISVTVPHRLGKVAAMARIQDLLPRVQAEHGHLVSNLKQAWNVDGCTFSFRAKGVGISGTLKVEEGAVSFEGELPWLVKEMKGGEIEDLIRTKAGELMA